MASDSHLSKGTLLGSPGWLSSTEEIKLPVLVFPVEKSELQSLH